MKLRRLPFAVLSAAALLAVTALAPIAAAEHEDRYGQRYGRDDRVALLAHELDDAAYHASQLSRHRSPGYRGVDAAFAELARAANDFHRVVETGRGGYEAERAFERVAARYYDLRWEFRVFHGPDQVRAAFHRINTPMEDLYRFYTGRDLYRDYDARRGVHQPRQRAPRYDVLLPRHDDRGHRGNRGRGRGLGRGLGRY